MTPRLTYKNIAILGLIQVGVVVAGVLGSGSVYKAASTFGFPLTSLTKFAVEYGFLMLAVPVVWITAAMIVQHRDQEGDTPEATTYLSGVLVLIVLLIGSIQAAALPWIRLLNPACSLGLSA